MNKTTKRRNIDPVPMSTDPHQAPEGYTEEVPVPNAMEKIKDEIRSDRKRKALIKRIGLVAIEILKQRFPVFQLITKPLDPMTQKRKRKTLKEKFEESSTYKGLVEFIVGVGLFGLSEDLWLSIIGAGIALVGVIDTIRRERKDGDD